MASAKNIDALKLEKWEDAFVKHPVGSVRVMEKQLRGALHEKREGLRALVSESYRDLLKTAERIVEMNDSIQQVESHLSQASKQCNFNFVQKKAVNAVIMKEKQNSRDRQSRMIVAETSVLSHCPAAISYSLSHDDSPLVAAKLYIVARLLRRSISEKVKSSFVVSLERQLSSLRVLILRHIEQEVCGLNSDPNKVLQCLSAYSLITSSSASDTFLEFQTLRLNAITKLLQQDDISAETILQAMQFVDENLRLSSQLFPRRFSDILNQLKLKPIFLEPAFDNMMDLNLAVHAHWISDSIKKYTPWLKVDDLTLSDCKSLTARKLGEALRVVLGGLEKAIRTVPDIKSLVRIRKDIISSSRALIRRSSKFDDEELKNSLNKTREILNTRIREVLNGDIDAISGLGQDLLKLVSTATHTRKKGPASWASMLSSFENARGGRNLKTMVKVVNYSDKAGLRSIRQKHIAWIDTITSNYAHVKMMNEKRDWDPDNDDDDDDFDAPESIEGMNDADSQSLVSTYVEGLLEGYRVLDTNLNKLSSEMHQPADGIESAQLIENACIMLRFISILRTMSSQYEGTNILDLRWFGQDTKLELHGFLARGVSRKALRVFAKDLSNRRWGSDVVFGSLWEGTPKLPVQPSPLVFRFLRTVVQSMNEIGVDIWSRDAADAMKMGLRERLWEEMKLSLEIAMKIPGKGDVKEEVQGTSTEETSESGDNNEKAAKSEMSLPLNREQCLQTYFDATYLDNALRTFKSRKSATDEKDISPDLVLAWELGEFIQIKVSIEADERERISRSAEDYWRRTSLLFGVLDI